MGKQPVGRSDVEVAGRLVEQKDLGADGQHGQGGHKLLLAKGQGPKGSGPARFQAIAAKERLALPLAGVLALSVGARPQGDLLHDRVAKQLGLGVLAHETGEARRPAVQPVATARTRRPVVVPDRARRWVPHRW